MAFSTDGALFDAVNQLLKASPPGMARAVVTMLAASYGVAGPSASGGGGRGLGGASGDDDEDDDDELTWQSSLGSSESVNLKKHDKKVARIIRGGG